MTPTVSRSAPGALAQISQVAIHYVHSDGQPRGIAIQGDQYLIGLPGLAGQIAVVALVEDASTVELYGPDAALIDAPAGAKSMGKMYADGRAIILTWTAAPASFLKKQD